jgi:hypothetical protein
MLKSTHRFSSHAMTSIRGSGLLQAPYELQCRCIIFQTKKSPILVNIYALCPQIRPRKINLLHELCMRLWYIVECEDAVSEFEEKVGTEGHESPERQLGRRISKKSLD